MSSTVGTIPPPISWAQRADHIFLTVGVECKDVKHELKENTFHFEAVNVLNDSIKYNVTLTFLHPIDPERTKINNLGRCIEFTIYKKEAGPFWPTLTGDKARLHFLTTNFNKWATEAEEEDESDEMNLPNFTDPQMENTDLLKDMDYSDSDDDGDEIPGLTEN